MNTEPDDNDLDATAELPQLDMQAAHSLYAAAGSEAASPALAGSLARSPLDDAGSSLEATANWPLVDELLTVRDKIVDLEATLLDAELKLAKLDKQHQELHSRHVELSAHDAELGRDRDRLDAERILLLESRQQLRQQFEAHQAEAAASTLALQQQIEQQRQQSITERATHATHHEQQLAELARHQETTQQLSATLLNEQTRIRALESSAEAAALAQANQQAAAAALARNLSHELVAKETLQAGLKLREQRIQTLEQAQQALTTQLADAEARHGKALTTMAELQTNLQAQARQIAELQNNLAVAEQRITSMNEQLETEQGHGRSAEQDKERLTRLAAAEHESYESTRKELSKRLSELSALQDQLAHAKADAAALGAQLTERATSLRSRDDMLAAKQQELLLAAEAQTVVVQRETALAESLGILQEELRQTQFALQERAQLLLTAEQQLAAERQAKQQMVTQLETTQQQLQQRQTQQLERDQFIVEQAAELDQLHSTAAELGAQLKRAEALVKAQQARMLGLETDMAPLRAEREQQALLLSQVQQELAAKREEQSSSAKQVEALQQDLHQHVETLTAIRRDIHQVAQQSRYRDTDLIVRTLVRVDDASVVHLLNKPVMIIGRTNDAEICVRSDSISRRHACLRVGRDVVIIEDLGSTNGCYVNGKRVKRQLLKDGDQLDIAGVVFRFATRISQA